jgi:CheY-like chemotaxis protein
VTELRLTVEDTGIGISADKLSTIFERFTQADASTTRRFGGTGLGLAISKQLTELMGGVMSVESRVGEGSKFWIILPLTLDRSTEEEAPPPADLSGVRILGVDDNPTNLFVLREQLNSWRLRNDMASTAEQALALLRAASAAGDPYQIAILDQQMPDVDGETLGRTIKSDPQIQDTALVMLTSMGLRGDAPRMLQAGFEAYLVKPARQSDLLETLGMVWAAQTHKRSSQLITRHTLSEAHASIPTLGTSAESLAGSAVLRGRILVVEDNSVNQKVATRLLEKMSFRVDVAADGSEALKMMELLPYDVVLMDCQMPVMDGYEATRQIRNREGNGSHRVIVAMTANAMQGDRERCIAAGMDDYISKPIRAPELAALLDRYIGKTTASITVGQADDAR